MSTARARVLFGTGLLLALIVGAATLSPATARPERPAPTGSDPFLAGQAYRGDFPDPTVLRVGSRYYAASTTVASLNLPTMTSTDLRTWTTRPASDPARPALNDAMPTPASWALKQQTAGGRYWAATWAPSVSRVAGSYLLAYSVPRAGDGRRCISLARSTSPWGPYVDSSRAPLSCGNNGVIDPYVFVDRGAVWMHYKMEGSPDRLLVRRMTNNASGFSYGSRNYTLLTPRKAWEGAVVENPAMLRFRKKLYLFYSGNGYGSSAYATGYAVCRRVTGPCKRKPRLLASGRVLAGPGGAHPFFDTAGRLRLAYHAWRTGNVGYPRTASCVGTAKGCAQRRMYVATIGAGKRGRLVVRRWS